MTMMERSIKEQLLLLLSGVLAVAVTPFAIFQLANEQWAIAILDISVVCALVGLFLHVYVHRETRGSAIVIALTGIAASLHRWRLFICLVPVKSCGCTRH
jgi:hypothetical protein